MAGTDDDPSTELPLDSPLWRSIGEVHRLLCRLTGDRHLAAKDLTDAQAHGHVCSMRRRLARTERSDRELLPRSFWADHEIDSWSDGLFVRRRGYGSIVRIQGYAFFVWGPELEKVWPTVFASSVAFVPKESVAAAEVANNVAVTSAAALAFPTLDELGLLKTRRTRKQMEVVLKVTRSYTPSSRTR